MIQSGSELRFKPSSPCNHISPETVAHVQVLHTCAFPSQPPLQSPSLAEPPQPPHPAPIPTHPPPPPHAGAGKRRRLLMGQNDLPKGPEEGAGVSLALHQPAHVVVQLAVGEPDALLFATTLGSRAGGDFWAGSTRGHRSAPKVDLYKGVGGGGGELLVGKTLFSLVLNQGSLESPPKLDLFWLPWKPLWIFDLPVVRVCGQPIV